jgi:Fur family ferric uptake transcriptional regulator
VEYIFEHCKEAGKLIDLSTVYRTLDTFESKDLVNKFDLGDGKYNYLLKEKAHKHIIECSCCHKEQEIDCPMVQIEELIKNKTGYTTMQHELKIKGICEDCKKDK